MGKNKKRSAGVIAAGAIALQLAISVVAPIPAQAAVWDCTTGYGATGPWGYCASGDSKYFRANLLCRNVVFKLYTKTVSGPRWPVGGKQPSTIPSCGWGEEWYGYIYMTGSN